MADFAEYDVGFLEMVAKDYRLFAEQLHKKGEERAAGRMRQMEFHAEKLAERVRAAVQLEEEPHG